MKTKALIWENVVTGHIIGRVKENTSDDVYHVVRVTILNQINRQVWSSVLIPLYSYIFEQIIIKGK